MFTRSRHAYTLTQLAGLADEMTPWLWARWAAYQCNRAEDAGTESGLITRAAVDYTMQMFYDDQMQEAYDEGRDPMEILKNVVGESWIYHQVCTFELGGMREFLDFIADGPLAANADWARSWDGAAMRGLRLEPIRARSARGDRPQDAEGDRAAEPRRRLAVRPRRRSGRSVGAQRGDAGADVRDHACRRRPADRAGGRGVDARRMDHGVNQGDLRRATGVVSARERGPQLASDVPSGAMIEMATRPADRERTRDEGRAGRDVVGRAAFRVLRDAAEGSLGGDEEAPYVAAAVLNPHAYAEAKRKLATPGRPVDWLRWAELAPEPARARLRRLAEISATEAA